MSAIDDKIVDGAMQLIRDYAEKMQVGKPIKVTQASDNASFLPSRLVLACIWDENVMTAVNFHPKYRAEMEEVARRCKEWK